MGRWIRKRRVRHGPVQGCGAVPEGLEGSRQGGGDLQQRQRFRAEVVDEACEGRPSHGELGEFGLGRVV
jgi:hypothetical protein